MRFILTADIPAGVHRPGVPLAQVLREIQPVVENASPLVSGRLTDRLTGATRAEWVVQELLSLSPDPVVAPGATHFVLTVDILYDIHEPGLAIAQILREVEPVIETMNPLAPGFLRDRLTSEIRADWLVGKPLVTAPIVTTYSPNPGPVETAFGMALTGNFFPTDAEVYFDRVPAPVTSVYSQWSITGTGPALPAGTHEIMLVCSGLGYCHFHWEFANPVDAPTLTSLTPNPAVAGADVVNCDGTGFTVDMKVVVDGALAAATQLVSPTRVTGVLAGPPALGAHPVLVRAAGYDTPPIDWVITAAPVYPTLTSLAPNPTPAGPGMITLDCIGTSFTSGSQIIVNGATSTTELISPTNLRTSVGNSGTPVSWPVLVRTPGAPDTPPINWVFEAAVEQQPA